MQMSKHHPKGPSRQKNFDPKSGGCCGFKPTRNDHANKFFGTVCHQIWDTGDKQLADQLEDPDFALGLVRDIQTQWEIVERQFVDRFGPITYTDNEHFIDGSPDLNFGTADRVRKAGRSALIGDGKFGWWRVEHAQNNLQGRNYAVLLWELDPTVDEIWVWFGNPRLQDYTLAKFTRGKHYQEFREDLVDRLKQGADPEKYHYDRLNCQFCSRWDCQTRLGRVRSYKAYLGAVTPDTMTNETLAAIKAELNGFKALIKGIDEEAKHRVFDDGVVLQGFEMKERVKNREIIGEDNLLQLHEFLVRNDLDAISERVAEITSVSLGDVEQLIVHAHNGSHRAAKPILEGLRECLTAHNALTTNSYYVVAAKNDEIE